MAARCTKHSFEVAIAQCRSCGEPFCDDCLVYTYGPSSPPFCVPCALVAAGVRRVSGAEKKAMKAARHKKVELDPTVRSPITMTVGYDGSAVDDVSVPASVATFDDEEVVVGTVQQSPEVAAADAADAELVGAGTHTGISRFSLAWVAIAVGLLLLLVPLVAGNV
jgi:hypothetical protein